MSMQWEQVAILAPSCDHSQNIADGGVRSYLLEKHLKVNSPQTQVAVHSLNTDLLPSSITYILSSIGVDSVPGLLKHHSL